MFINETNKEIFIKNFNEHLSQGGKVPEAYGFTQLIKEAIINKSYILYNGGGPYDVVGKDALKKYDVVVSFIFSGDPHFGVIMEEDLDFCDVYSSNDKGELVIKSY